MKPTDLDCCQACSDTYRSDADWDKQWTQDDIHVALRKVSGVDVVAFRGSVDAKDWFEDFRGLPRHHPLVGWCHRGFLDGMDFVVQELLVAGIGKKKPFAITGHSLGAARALIVAGILTAHKIYPARIITFGTPRPGMSKLSRILNNGGYPIRHYKNGPDPVADVPFAIPFLWPYRKPQHDLALNVPPEKDEDDPFKWHNISLYLLGIAAQAMRAK
jgi:hypothetical protein